MARAKLGVEDKGEGVKKPSPGGLYFGKPNTSLQFVPSGCKNLDLALGGGWARRRIANIVGNRSSGKTLLAIEASANFAIVEPKGKIRYRESESAFDERYAQALGFPLDRVDFGDPIDTVEDLFEDMEAVIEGAKDPELYIVDSLDALSDRHEMERDIDEGSYGAEKAKKMSQLFRRLTSSLATKDIMVIIVSQVRDNIGGGPFAKKHVRSGGRAMDFYASQVVMLSELKKLKRTVSNIERVVGIEVKAVLEKNKVALPYRDATFPIMFGYGIDDCKACEDWLKQVGIPFKKEDSVEDLRRMVEEKWWAIEQKFLPTQAKYK
jgi:recombination protein RecA